MKITFNGKQDKLNPSQERKLAMAFAKLSKLLEQRGEKGAQVILSSERHLHRAEVCVNFYGNTLVGVGSATDQFTAMMDAVDKVEKQALRSREKWRDNKRGGKPAPAEVPAAKRSRPKPAKIVKSHARPHGKPMTVEEAMLTMEDDRDYMVYHDADTNKRSVLVRRRDGKIDLVEA